ncbi:MAG: hypothetical protein IPI91_20840 [Flavobacteriales bacterium]|nr:hypothetical protein [Flavobacteriales bacterium]
MLNTDGATDSTWCRYRATYRYCAEGLIDCAKTDQAILYHLFDPFQLDSAATSNISVEAYERVSALSGLQRPTGQ